MHSRHEIVDHYAGPATLVPDDGPPQPVEIDLQVEQEMIYQRDTDQEPVGGLKSWRADVTGHAQPLLVGRARLEIPDGRRGQCNVTGHVIEVTTMGAEWQATLNGNGALVGDGPLTPSA